MRALGTARRSALPLGRDDGLIRVAGLAALRRVRVTGRLPARALGRCRDRRCHDERRRHAHRGAGLRRQRQRYRSRSRMATAMAPPWTASAAPSPSRGNVPGWPAACCGAGGTGALAGADAPGRLAACCGAGSGTGALGGADRCCGGTSRGPATVDCAAGAVPPRVTAPPCRRCTALRGRTALPDRSAVHDGASRNGHRRTRRRWRRSRHGRRDAPWVKLRAARLSDSIPAPADAPPATAGGADGLGAGAANAGFLFACEYSADAGVGVPRSPGRTTGAVPGPGATLGAVASSGADVTCDAGSATMFDRTGLRPTSVAPETAVMAPGTPMCEYRAGGPFGRSFTFTAHGRL